MLSFKNIFMGLLIAAPTTHTANQAMVKSPEQIKDTVSQTAHKSVTYDKYAKYREAEKAVLPMLVFYEGCSRKAYQDIVGIWTIGIGNTKHPDGTKVTSKDYLKNNHEILAYVRSHLEREVYPKVNKYITRRLPPHQMAALLSLCYNCGTRVLGKDGVKSPLANAVNKGNNAAVTDAFMKKVSTKKHRFVEGLAIRRASEIYCYQGLVSPQDMMDFYVGGQRGLSAEQVLRKDKTGKYSIVKTDSATVNLFKQHCRMAPTAAEAKKYAWFGGNKRVGEFASLQDEVSFSQKMVAYVKHKSAVYPRNSEQTR